MTRGCSICQRAPAKKATCCGQRLCADHETSHDCPRAAELTAIASDPKRRRAWLAERKHEDALTTDVIDALNKVPGVRVRRTKRRQGARSSDDLDGVLDVAGHAAPDGIAIYVEMKKDHADGCGCPSCAGQRDFGKQAAAAGCVVVLNVRSVAAAVDGVRMGLARARGRSAA